jgi:hypothetical protein
MCKFNINNTYSIALIERSSNGISVCMIWDSKLNQIAVHVDSPGDDFSFTLYPSNENAMDCFNHPYAYRGRVETEMNTQLLPDVFSVA